jgi:hypothetical protein
MISVPLVAEKDISQAGFFSRLFDWILLFFTKLIS